MKFEALSERHLSQLLEFETENRRWFESFIAPRGDGFYSEESVAQHIEDLVANMDRGLGFSGVLIVDGEIVGRGNLKDVSDGKAAVGYRISKRFTSRGFASYCLRELVQTADSMFDIRQLEALVLDNNPASSKVLEKNGFVFVEYMPCFDVHDNVVYGCKRFHYTYP